jgi:hypothetical protein
MGQPPSAGIGVKERTPGIPGVPPTKERRDWHFEAEHMVPGGT